MQKTFNAETWRAFLEKFSSYEGSVSGFCRENNISKSQFYYYKKRFEESNKPTFHAVVLKSEDISKGIGNNDEKLDKDIRIEIGKDNIYTCK